MEKKDFNTANIRKGSITTRDLVQVGLLIALVFISTRFINIRLPISINGGLIHLGNCMLFTIAIVFGKHKGALAGAFGMALFDIFSSWVIWAPFTFIIRGAMGYIIGSIANNSQRKGDDMLINVLAIGIAGIVMIFGYYITEVILYGNLYAPITSVPGNVVQIVIGMILGIPLSKVLIRYKKYF